MSGLNGLSGLLGEVDERECPIVELGMRGAVTSDFKCKLAKEEMCGARGVFFMHLAVCGGSGKLLIYGRGVHRASPWRVMFFFTRRLEGIGVRPYIRVLVRVKP